MNKNFKLPFLLTAFASSLSPLIADDEGEMSNCATQNCCETPCSPVSLCPPDDTAYNAPHYLTSCAWSNLYVEGSFLYWHASGDYLAYAFLNHSSDPNPASVENLIFKGSVIEPDFQYDPGFKVGLGYKTSWDNWDLYAGYTRFHQTVNSSKSVSGTDERLHALWVLFVLPSLLDEDYRFASSKWGLKWDELDVELGRDFYCGQYLTLRPTLGLRTLWLTQTYNLKYITDTTETPIYSSNQSKSWGIGPRFSLSNSWNLCWNLRLMGDFGFTLLAVQDQVAVKQTTPVLIQFGAPDDVSYKNRESLNTIKPLTDLSLGLGWDTNFCDKKYRFDLAITYDYTLYWQQDSISIGHAPLVVPGGTAQVVVGSGANPSGNIGIQGLTITARLDF